MFTQNVLVLFLSAFIGGQAASGQITGIVKDSAGKAVAGVTVAVTSTERNTSRTVVTNADGLYKVASLTPGAYVLEVRQGDAVHVRRDGLRIVTGETAVVDIALPVRLTETVNVTADSPLLRTDRASLGT